MVKAKRKYGFEPDYAIPPGETLREVMESLDMKQTDLSCRTGLTVQTLARIFKGEPITYETANRLELATGVSARKWNSLEAQYREQLVKLDERRKLEKDIDWLKMIPTKDLIDRGTMTPSEDKVTLLREVLKFYGVSSVEAWEEMWQAPGLAARRSKCFQSDPGRASAWIRLGEVQSQHVQCYPYEKGLFEQAVHSIRKLTVKPVQEAVDEARRLCADAGVAISLVPEMKKVPWHGATKWLSAEKAMILLSLRGKFEDQFWFSFFHEAGHVLHDSRDCKRKTLINDRAGDDPREKKADLFAQEILIPKQYRNELKSLRSNAQVIALAKRLGISPGIVVGQFQHMTGKWKLFNGLKRRFEWA